MVDCAKQQRRDKSRLYDHPYYHLFYSQLTTHNSQLTTHDSRLTF